MSIHDSGTFARAVPVGRPHEIAAREAGLRNYLAGHSAECQVAADYARRGYALLHQCWRGKQGEVDLILRDGPGLLFVEVKKARDFDTAVQRLGQRQLRRIARAAQEYMQKEGYSLRTLMRFDVALVNAHGEIRVIENIYFD